MTVKEYLLSGSEKLSEVGAKMYPNNKNAIEYLSRKLNGKDGRTFTKADAEKAKKILMEKCACIDTLTID